jgi:hypothetical protein
MMTKMYPIPNSLADCFTLLDDLFNNSQEDKDWINSSSEDDVVSGLHGGIGMRMRNEWGFWTRDTELYNTLNNMGLWHADDMYNVIMTSYYRKLHGKELDLKGQIQNHINYWKEYEKINGPVEKE